MFPYLASSSSSGAHIASSSSNPRVNRPLNPRIWSRLPRELVDRIISFLPPPAFYRFRVVCRRWNHLPCDTEFLKNYLACSPPPHKWFLFFKCRTPNNIIYTNDTASHSNGNMNGNEICDAYMLDPHAKRWYRLRVPFPWTSLFTPAASSGGLVAWVSDASGHKTLALHNPLDNNYTPIGQVTRAQRLRPAVGFCATDTKVFVMVVGDDFETKYNIKNLTLENYDVNHDWTYYTLWQVRDGLPKGLDIESGRMVFAGGRFYCVSYRPFHFYAYDHKTHIWSEVLLPMPRSLRSPCVVECQGRLFLVSGINKQKLTIPKSLRMWSLNGDGLGFTAGDVMPQQLYEEFLQVECGNGFECVGNGDFIVIMIKRSDRMMLFDFNQRAWQWLPPCPLVYQMRIGYDEVRGFAYDPKIATPGIELIRTLNHFLGVGV